MGLGWTPAEELALFRAVRAVRAGGAQGGAAWVRVALAMRTLHPLQGRHRSAGECKHRAKLLGLGGFDG